MRFPYKEHNKFLSNGSRKVWPIILLILVAIIFMALLTWILPKDANLLGVVTCAGVLIALWQAISTNYQNGQLLKKDIIVSLYETYVQRDMHRAIKDVWETMKQQGAGVIDISSFLEKPDRYQFLKSYLGAQTLVRQQEIDESRRMVTHFWYLLENLLKEGIVSEDDVFEWFGPPDVIWILEGLEVLRKHADTAEASETPWPPLLTLSRYYRLKGVNIEKLESGSIPLARLDRVTIEQIKRL